MVFYPKLGPHSFNARKEFGLHGLRNAQRCATHTGLHGWYQTWLAKQSAQTKWMVFMGKYIDIYYLCVFKLSKWEDF